MPTGVAAVAALEPATAQRIFRAVLDALARPGTVTRLPAGPLVDVPSALLPVLALSDVDTTAHVREEAGFPSWTDFLRTGTGVSIVDGAHARLVAVLRPLEPGELAGFCRGSAEEPEAGALVCAPVAAIGTGTQFRLGGPGVRGERTLAIGGLPAGFAADRAAAVADFPAGIDLLLSSSDGRLVGLPRTSRLIVEGT